MNDEEQVELIRLRETERGHEKEMRGLKREISHLRDLIIHMLSDKYGDA